MTKVSPDTIKVETPFVNFRVSSTVKIAARTRCPILHNSLSLPERVIDAPSRRTLYSLAARLRIQTTSLRVPSVSSIVDLRLIPPSAAYSERRVIGTLIVTPSKQAEAAAFIESKFSQFGNDVFGILAYIDDTTFEFTKYIPSNASIRLFISATGGDAKKIVEKLREENARRTFDIIQLTFVDDSSERPLFHERWIADGKVMIDMGTDLKKATLASKAHTISLYDAGAYRDRIEIFQKWWESDEASLSEYFGGKIRRRRILQTAKG